MIFIIFITIITVIIITAIITLFNVDKRNNAYNLYKQKYMAKNPFLNTCKNT